MLQVTNKMLNIGVTWLAFLLCILDALHLILGPETIYPDTSCGFPKS
jgi:hypothetical protein